jgi:hypothetical protein
MLSFHVRIAIHIIRIFIAALPHPQLSVQSAVRRRALYFWTAAIPLMKSKANELLLKAIFVFGGDEAIAPPFRLWPEVDRLRSMACRQGRFLDAINPELQQHGAAEQRRRLTICFNLLQQGALS